MFLNNQTPKSFLATGKFTPVSRSTTSLGTTVTYSLNPGSGINAYNTSYMSSSLNPMQPLTQFNQWPNQWQSQNMLSGYTGYSPYMDQILAHSHNAYVTGAIVQPSIDISETSSDVIVVAHVGNINVTDINLSTTENSVTITASGWMESQNISLNRTVALPTSIKAEAVDASLQSGILEIKCPKAERTYRNRVIVKADQINNTPNTIIE